MVLNLYRWRDRHSVSSAEYRSPTVLERRLIRAVFAHTVDLTVEADWLTRLRVRTLDDGGMGSLLLHLGEGDASPGRQFGQTVAEVRFSDADGVPVFVALNLDQHGMPYELDVWKADLSAVREIPDTFEPAPCWADTERVLDPDPRLRGRWRVERRLARLAARSLERGQSAQVKLRFYVEPNGRPVDVQVVDSSGDPGIDEAVVQIFARARFYPGMYRSRAMRTLVEMTPKLFRRPSRAHSVRKNP
jgi:TonB family protein